MKACNGFGIMTSTFVTGEIPNQAFGILGGREDFGSLECRSMWAGCLDAVEYIPAGGVIVVEPEGVIVPRSVDR
jgi:hypothetical protein